MSLSNPRTTNELEQGIADTKAFLRAHNIDMGDLTLQEKWLTNSGRLAELKQRLEDRGVLLCPGLMLTPENETAEEEKYFDFDTEWDGVLPPDAELFFDDGEFAFYRSTNDHVYITQSQSTESPSDEEEHDIRTMIKVLDNIVVVMEDIRNILVRSL